MKTSHDRLPVGLNAKFRKPIIVVAVLSLVAIAVGAWFVHGNQTSYPSCTGLEYHRLQSLWSAVSMPPGASAVSGPTKSCTTRGIFGRLTSVGYVVNAGSYANYLALENDFRTSLAKDHLSAIQTSKDQLEMARGANTAFYMVLEKPATGGSGEFLVGITFQDGPI